MISARSRELLASVCQEYLKTDDMLGRDTWLNVAGFYEIVFYSRVISLSDATFNSQPEDCTYVGTGMYRNCVKWHPVMNGT